MFCLKAGIVMQRLSYPTETVLSNKTTRKRIVLSFKDSPRKPLRRWPNFAEGASVIKCSNASLLADALLCHLCRFRRVKCRGGGEWALSLLYLSSNSARNSAYVDLSSIKVNGVWGKRKCLNELNFCVTFSMSKHVKSVNKGPQGACTDDFAAVSQLLRCLWRSRRYLY